MNTISIGPITWIPEAKAIFNMSVSSDLIKEPDSIEKIGNWDYNIRFLSEQLSEADNMGR